MEVTKQGPYANVLLLDAVELTGSFAGNISTECYFSPFNQAEMFIEYTQGAGESGNNALLKIEFQETLGGTWKEFSITSDAEPVDGIVISTVYPRRLKIVATSSSPERRWFAFPTGAEAIRVSAMEEGVVGIAGTLTVGIQLSNVQKVD